MSVQIKFTTKLRTSNERFNRSMWLAKRIPTQEYHIEVEQCPDTDGWDPEDNVETTVIIWHNDAEKIATEFWFHFP